MINKEIYDSTLAALRQFSDIYPNNTEALRVDATVVVSPNVTVTNGAGAAAVNIQDGGNSITVDAINLDTRDLSPATDGVAIYGSDDGGTTKRIIKTDAGGAIQVDLEVASVTVNNGAGAAAVNIQDGGNSITIDATTLPLPTGAATSANQTTEIASLASIDAGIPAALGQTTMAASMPVTIASNQTAIPVTTTPSGTQDVNLTQILGVAPSATNPVPARPTNGTAFLANLGETAATGQFIRLTDGTDTALVTAAGELNVLATAQPGIDIGDVTVNNSAGAAAVNIQDGGNSITIDSGQLPATLGQKAMTASFAVVVASDQTAVPISAASLPLPTGASTSALQTTGNTSLASIDGKLPATLGQKAMAASLAVVLASDQSSIPVSNTQLTLGTTGADTTVAANAASVTLKASNTARKSLTIRNDGTGILYVSKTATATASAAIKLLQDDTVVITDYSGIVTGIWTSANGNAQIEEVS